MRLPVIILLLLATVCEAAAQRPVHVKWSANVVADSPRQGTLVLTAVIDEGWHIFGMSDPSLGPDAVAPQFTEFTFAKTSDIVFLGDTEPSTAAAVGFDESLKLNLPMWEGTVTFSRRFALARGVEHATVAGTVEYMACTSQSCTPPTTVPFSVEFGTQPAASAAPEADKASESKASPVAVPDSLADTPSATDDTHSMPTAPYLLCLLLGFAGGLLAQGAVALFKKKK